MKKSIREIKKILKKHKSELKKKYRIKKISIFGSYVRDQQRDTSDVDIIVEFEEIPDLLEFVRLEEYLKKILGIKVDLVTKESISPYIKKYIEGEVIPI